MRLGASAGRAADGATAPYASETGVALVMGASGIAWKGWLEGEMVNIPIVFPTVLLIWSSKLSIYVSRVKERILFSN